MAEILEGGYISLRTLIANEWNEITLLNDADDEVISVDLTEDNWIHSRLDEEVLVGYDNRGRPVYDTVAIESNSAMEIEVVVTGADLDTLPATVSQSVISETYSTDAGREVSKETFQPFTFESVNDELTINHKINVPIG
ncbi:hypothetical protein ACUL41_06985 [Virgibacillus natechei]